MSVQTLVTGVATDVGVTLLDGSDVAVSGVAVGDITVRYRKNGASLYTTKSVLAGEWTEVGDGLYKLSFTSGELDTSGSFRYLVTGASFSRHENDAILSPDYQDLATQIIELKQLLAAKANIGDVDTLFHQLELRIAELESELNNMKDRLSKAEASLAALRAT